MKRKLTLLFLSLVCICTFVFGLSACVNFDGNGTNGGNNKPSVTYPQSLRYELNRDGQSYSLKTFLPITNETEITIPSEYEGLPVTAIDNNAFSGGKSLTGITIPNSIISIGDGAFRGCTALKNMTIPDSVTFIDEWAFSECTSLISVTIPESVTSIGENAFNSCISLTNITVGENNTAYKSMDGNLYSKDGTQLIQYALGKTSADFTIPDSVILIGNNAFSECASLTSVVIPDSVTSIGENAFNSCTSLTNIIIPDSVKSVGRDAFYQCASLTIYCEAEEKPGGWNNRWNMSDCPVVWGYKG